LDTAQPGLMEALSQIIAKDYAFTIAVLAAGFVAGVLAYWIVRFILRRWRKISVLQKSGFKSARLEKPLRSLLPALFMLALSPFTRVSGGAELIVTRILSLWVIGSCGWLAIGLLRVFLADLLSRYDIDVEDNLKVRRIYTQVSVIENIAIAVIVLVTVSLMLMRFETVRQIGTGLIASAGVVGIVIGFAAQKTLGNFIAGIQIALSQPIRIDDVVIVENEWGWIEEITLTYVVVRIWDLRRLVVPIGYFIEKPFQNWTRVSADILGTVYIYADYTVSVAELRKELSRILRESQHWDGKVDVLQVTGASDRTVEIRALMSAETSPQAWDLRCEVREKLLEFLQKSHAEALPRTRIELNRDAHAKSVPV
jgi:small-conductance mechanosensitive channel